MNFDKLTVILPVYNEENSILSILKKLDGLNMLESGGQIIVVNDGSQDKTINILQDNVQLYSNLISYNCNRGKGFALIKAMELARNDYLLIQDADLEYDPSDIPRMWKYVQSMEVDLLLTTRFAGGEVTRVHYFWHKVGNRVITLAFNLLNNTTFSDIYSGYILFKRDKVEREFLKFTRWGQQAELLTYLVSNSNYIYEVPIKYFGRSYAEGKKIRATAMFSVLFSIFISKLRLITKK